jgi:hypothetical protein
MNMNMLILNQDKTELIVFSSKHQAKKMGNLSMQLGNHTLNAATSVKNLGVTMDSSLSMDTHVSDICKSCFYQIRNIGHIRQYITTDACKTLVQALVTSRLDYGNALLYGVPNTVLKRLQRVQNCAARLITRTRKREHISPVLRELHWIPVQHRPSYKILMYVYKALHGLAPDYLSDLIQLHQPARSLRSGSRTMLTVPHTHSATYGNRCLTQSAADLWNSLPEEIKTARTLVTFKKQLKTHLFKLAHNV